MQSNGAVQIRRFNVGHRKGNKSSARRDWEFYRARHFA
jgi:hypothetical protein